VTGLVLGVGMSSKATGDEVRQLVERVAEAAGVGLDAVAAVATRERFVDDERLHLGPPVLGVTDRILLDRYPAPEPAESDRRFGARVAEGCALIGAGEQAELLVATTRSAHATAALAAPAVTPGTDR
jgi:cobalt-precorrin 5A hydrolase/precorrin-3B C17-methyltransferase